MAPNRLKMFMVWETRRLLILVGRDGDTNRIIEVNRDVGCQLILNEDYTKAYTTEKLMEYLRRMKASLLHDRVYCFFGFVRLHESYYLIAVTNASVVANIHGHDIYSVMGTSLIPVTYMPRKTVEETKYRALLNSIDLTNCCYFSYTYDLTSSMQRQEQFANHVDSVQDMFVWNKSAIEPLEYLEKECLATNVESPHTWVTYIIHGSLQQKSADFRGARGNHTKLHDDDTHHLRLLTYTLIARRSRHFAGARYLRRGVNEEGFVANEVETEQIITASMAEIGVDDSAKADPEVGPAPENYKYADPVAPMNHTYRSSSMVQVRGSIPLYWHHINLLSPAPDIVTERMAPASLPAQMPLRRSSGDEEAGAGEALVSYPASRAHFKRLYERYGPHVDVLNLVKLHHSKREVTIGMAFVKLCNSLNRTLNLSFLGQTPKKEKKKAVGVEPAAQVGEESSSEDEETDEEGEGDGGWDPEGGAVIWKDSHHRPHKSKTDNYSPLEEDEGTGEDCVEEEDYPLTYHAFDLLNYHEAEHSNGHKAKDGHSLMNVRTSSTNDSDSGKEGAVIRADSEASSPASVDVFQKLSEITSDFQERTGFYVQAPRVGEGAAPATAAAVSFPLVEGDEDAMGLSHRSFLEPSDAAAAASAAEGAAGPTNEHSEEPPSEVDAHKGSDNDAGAGAGERGHAGEDLDHDHELVWRDVTVEDISSWISDGRMRRGATCRIRQQGVLRTNCIDCLDRTNIAQFVHAKQSILHQCRALGVCLTHSGLNHVLQMTTDLWTRHGNDLAVQYGGSGAMHSLAFVSESGEGGSDASSVSLAKGLQHSLSSTSLAMMREAARAKGKDLRKFLRGAGRHLDKEEEEDRDKDKDKDKDKEEKEEEEELDGSDAKKEERGDGKEHAEEVDVPSGAKPEQESGPRFKLTGGIKNGLVAVNRYYANVTSDYDKQQAMDLILGMFVPSKDRPAIWEFDLQPQYHRSEIERYCVAKQEAGDGQEEDGAKGAHFDPLVLIGKGLIW